MPKGTIEPKPLDDLLAGFEPKSKPSDTPAAIARKSLVASAESNFQSFAQTVASNISAADDKVAVQGAIQALLTAKQRAVKAINSIPDEAFNTTDEAQAATPDEQLS